MNKQVKKNQKVPPVDVIGGRRFKLNLITFHHINQPFPKWENLLRQSGTWGKLARNGQMLYDKCWAISLIMALLLTFMSHLRPAPSPYGGIWWAKPTQKCTIPPNWNMRHYKLMEFCPFLQCQGITQETGKQKTHTNHNIGWFSPELTLTLRRMILT